MRFDDIVRTERYFTSTLLPLIIFHDWQIKDGVKKFVGRVDAEAAMNGTEHNKEGHAVPIEQPQYGEFDDVEVITEFHIARDLGFPRGPRGGVDAERRDAPDVVILSGRELIVCEAKFFDRFNASDLNDQLASQRMQIRYLFEKRPSLRAYRHVAIVPRRSKIKIDADVVLTWDDIANMAKDILGSEHYATERLKSAVSKYERDAGDPDTLNYDGTENLEAMLEKCRSEGDDIQVGYIGGEGDLSRLDLPSVKSRRRWKWRNRHTNQGVIENRNWILGKTWREIILGKIAAETSQSARPEDA